MTVSDFVLQTITSIIVGLCGSGLIVWIARTWISEKLKSSIKAEYDLQLETHKAKLTELVEGVKSGHAKELEHIKSMLLSEEQISERRRRVYEEICLALRVFIAGHGNSATQQEQFHTAHAKAWLWASDEALATLNRFLALKVREAGKSGDIDPLAMEKAYVSVILAMRKDAGFPDSAMNHTDYNFIRF